MFVDEYPEIRRLNPGTPEPPSGFEFADFSQPPNLIFAVRCHDDDENAHGSRKGGGGESGLPVAKKSGGAGLRFVERPEFAGAVELMWSQILEEATDPFFAAVDAQTGEEEQVSRIHDFFRVVEVLFREYHSVDVCKTRDSVYTKVCGREWGLVCGSMRNSLLTDRAVRARLKALDLLLTAAHFVVLAMHTNYEPDKDRAAAERRNDRLYFASFVITVIVALLVLLKALVLRPKRFVSSKSNRVDLVCVPAALLCTVLFYDAPSPYRDMGAMIMSVRLLRLVLSVGVFKKLYVLFVGKECKFFLLGGTICIISTGQTNRSPSPSLSSRVCQNDSPVCVDLILTLQSVLLSTILWATLGMIFFSGGYRPIQSDDDNDDDNDDDGNEGGDLGGADGEYKCYEWSHGSAWVSIPFQCFPTIFQVRYPLAQCRLLLETTRNRRQYA